MKTRLTLTEDGSHTLYVPELNEHYHSTHGSIQESSHVFIANGLATVNKKQLKIFEVGFGTGLNAILSLQYAQKNAIELEYHGIEKYPLDQKTVSELNFTKHIHENYASYFDAIHRCSWNEVVSVTELFKLKKIEADLNSYVFEALYDLVYFDAFAYNVQPEMWSVEIFKKINHCLNDSGTLVTYASKGIIKQNLKEAGFEITRLPGAKGKFHMLKATKRA